jgi:hypothetical protein
LAFLSKYRAYHRGNLLKLLNVTPRGGMTTEALWYYEVLYLSGRQPDVVNRTCHYEYEYTVEEACRRNEIYFQIFDVPADKSLPVLRRYFEENSKDGLVSDVSHINTAMLFWRV